jgi:hypothetical protein
MRQREVPAGAREPLPGLACHGQRRVPALPQPPLVDRMAETPALAPVDQQIPYQVGEFTRSLGRPPMQRAPGSLYGV